MAAAFARTAAAGVGASGQAPFSGAVTGAGRAGGAGGGVPATAGGAASSALSRHLRSLRCLPSSEARSDASLADVVDSAMRSLLQSSLQHKPSVQRLFEGLPQADRQETLVWLVQAFEVMQFTDAALFDTALLLDRYYASLPREEIRVGASHCTLLAAVCICLKTGSHEETHLSLRQTVAYLGRSQVPFADVLNAEIAILRKLRWNVGTPTAREFLESFSTRLKNVDRSVTSLAEFLLQLTLVDAQLHYWYTHSVLAVSCLALALFATRAPRSAYEVVLEDFAVCYPEHAPPPIAQMVPCCADIHALWVQAVGGQELPTRAYTRHVCTKFGRPIHHAVSNLTPPAQPPAGFPLPPSHSWAGPRDDALDQPPPVAHHALVQSPPSRERGEGIPHVLQCGHRSDDLREQCPACMVHFQIAESRASRQDAATTMEALARDLRRLSVESRCLRCGRPWRPVGVDHGSAFCATCGEADRRLPSSRERPGISAAAAAVAAVAAAGDIQRDQDPQQWRAALAARLREPAEQCWKVRIVLARHGWVTGQFRRTPDREQLLRDLARAARASTGSGSGVSTTTGAGSSASASVASADSLSVAALSSGGSSADGQGASSQRSAAILEQARLSAATAAAGSNAAAVLRMRRRRAASWSSHRAATAPLRVAGSSAREVFAAATPAAGPASGSGLPLGGLAARAS